MNSESRPSLLKPASGVEPFDHALERLVFHFSIATSLMLFTFGIIYVLKGQQVLGMVEIFFGIILVINLYGMGIHKDLIQSSRILLFSSQFMSYVIFITGGIGGTGNIWILFIPLFTMLLLKKEEAIRSLIIYTILLAVIIVAGIAGIYELKYDLVVLRQTVLIFLLFQYLTYHNEKLKNMVLDKLQEKNRELEHLSRTDHLTSVANRLSLNEKLEYEYSRVQRYHEPLSLIIIDIDYFKSINDKYGHLTGDKVLKAISRIFSKNIRDIDLIGRWGGEEFMIVLPNTTLNDTKEIAEKLRVKLSKHNFGLDRSITASFGVTQYQEPEELSTFIQRADHFLYSAKERGRNRVIAQV